MTRARFGILLYRWHGWVGLASGLFLLVICATGSVAVFRPEIERAVDWGAYDFRVVPSGNPVSIEQAIATAEAAHPGGRAVVARRPALGGSAHSHDACYSVVIDQAKGPNLNVLVDPYRNAVVASVVPNRGWGQWLRDLHVRLLYGSYWGRWLVGFFGLMLVFSTVTGLLIFTRFNRGSWAFSVRRGKGPRILLADVHKVVGLTTVAFNLIFGVTGAVVGLEGLYLKYFPKEAIRTPKIAAVSSLPPGQVERLMTRAAELVPGTTATEVQLNHRRNGLAKVEVEHGPLHLVREHASFVLFNAATADPVHVYDATKASAAGRFYFAMEPLHFGRLGGAMWVKLLWALMGLSGSFLSLSGFAIFVLRKRKPRRATATELPPTASSATIPPGPLTGNLGPCEASSPLP